MHHTTMPQLIVYALIVISAVLPLMYRRSKAVRVCSVGLLCLIAVLHIGFLIGLPMLVMEGYHPLNTPNTTDLPDAYMAAVNEVERCCETHLGPFVALVFAFATLALIPAKTAEESTTPVK